MFFSISKIEQAAHHADELHNPQTAGNPMVIGVYRNLARTAFFEVYSKKAYAEFWDDILRKKIPNSYWTAEMKALALQKIAIAPKPPFIFKVSIVGWLFVLLIGVFVGWLIYDSVKAPVPMTAGYTAMEQTPELGDLYFGHFEVYNNPGDRIASQVRFGWFKVIQVERDTYYLAKSREMSTQYQPKEQLNSTTFETTGIPAKITEQAGYLLNLKSMDGKITFYMRDKKKSTNEG